MGVAACGATRKRNADFRIVKTHTELNVTISARSRAVSRNASISDSILASVSVLLNLCSRLLERGNDPSGILRPEARHVNIAVIIRDLLLTYHYEIAEAKVQIFFHLEALLDDFVKLFGGQADALEPLLKLERRWKVARQLVSRISDFLLRGHDRRYFLCLLQVSGAGLSRGEARD